MMNFKRLGIRDTFGDKDKQGNRYPDVKTIEYYPCYVSLKTLETGLISYKSETYIIHADSKTRNRIRLEDTYCMISFQRRTNGLFAFARLFNSNRSKRNSIL